MRGSGKTAGKDPEDYEDQFLHQTIGGSRIKSHSSRLGSHKLGRHYTSSPLTPPSVAHPSSGASSGAGTSATAVSNYLENLPALNVGTTAVTPPPRPPRPPGGLLGISNGRGMGYQRSLGSSYDSPVTSHDSFNGHVRSGANLYGGSSQSSGVMPFKATTPQRQNQDHHHHHHHHRPTTSIFPIQKALEISLKEMKLLQAASSRGGASSSSTGTGMSTGMTFVRELRQSRNARYTGGGVAAQHANDRAEPVMSEHHAHAHAGRLGLDQSMTDGVDDVEDMIEAEDNCSTGYSKDTPIVTSMLMHGNNSTPRMGFSSSSGHEYGDIRIQRPPIAATFDAKAHYPGIAHLPLNGGLNSSTGAVAIRYPSPFKRPAPSSQPQDTHRQHAATSASASAPPSHAFDSSTLSAQPLSPTTHSPILARPLQSMFSPSPSTPSSRFLSSHSSLPLSPSYPASSTSSISSSGSAVHAVRELLDSYPAPSPYCVDEKKRSPLHFAAASGDLELVEFLLERGVRPDCGRDIAGNMPLHLVAALLKAGADMTLASPMTYKTPLDLAESRLSYLLSRAQEASKLARPGSIDLFNQQVVTTRSSRPPQQSPALLEQIKGIVSLLRPYVARQQKLKHGERQKERHKERSWERADKYMRQHGGEGSSSGDGMWRPEVHSEDNYGDMEDDGDDDDDDDDDRMMDDSGARGVRKMGGQRQGQDGDMDLIEDDLPPYSKYPQRLGKQPPRIMDTDETEEALENLMNGLSLLEANRKQQEHHKQQQQQVQQISGGDASNIVGHAQGHAQTNVGYVGIHQGSSDIGDGNLADNEHDPGNENDVDDGLPDLLEQVQQVLQAIKLNEKQI
ncbi:hypothetical protein BGZ94_004229 [Podila epigama]|nr:hypothetical protein BGZ94_004229 [Podila epigama]